MRETQQTGVFQQSEIVEANGVEGFAVPERRLSGLFSETSFLREYPR
jgi:hypothetical protein